MEIKDETPFKYWLRELKGRSLGEMIEPKNLQPCCKSCKSSGLAKKSRRARFCGRGRRSCGQAGINSVS